MRLGSKSKLLLEGEEARKTVDCIILSLTYPTQTSKAHCYDIHHMINCCICCLFKYFMISWLTLVLLLASVSAQGKQYFQTMIMDNWSMNLLSGPANINPIKDKTYPTSIPTTLHLVLQNAGDIPDPFLKENYPTLKYLSDCNVRFATNFTVDDLAFAMDHQQLVF